MKKIVFGLFISAVVFSSCMMKEEKSFQKATITGPDRSMCACCGGWFIDIGNKTYRFYDLPENSTLDIKNANFPVRVELQWRKDKAGCKGDEIIVEKIKKDTN